MSNKKISSIDQKYNLSVLFFFFLVLGVIISGQSFCVDATDMDSVGVRITFTPSITIDDVTVIEGEVAIFTLELGMTADEPVTVSYTTADDSALAGEDYESVSGTVTFLPGETETTISVPTVENGVDEPDEDFFVNLSNVQGPAVISDPQGVGTILDDDGSEASIVIGDDTQYEGDPEEFVVRLSNPVSETVTVEYYTVNGTALAGEDFEGVSENLPETIKFEPGDIEKRIIVDTVENNVEEPEETFEVVLENVTGPAVILDGTGEGTILDTGGNSQVGGGGGTETCTPICPPSIPLLQAEQIDGLATDDDGNGMVDRGDTLRYSVKIEKLEPADFTNVILLNPISHHLEFVEGSLNVSSGKGRVEKIHGQQVVYVEFRVDDKNEGALNFPLKVDFSARVDNSLPGNISRIASQGTVYSSSSSTVVTDDPDTSQLDDPTSVLVGNKEGDGGNEKPDPVTLRKEVLRVEDSPPVVGEAGGGVNSSSGFNKAGLENRLISRGSLVKFALSVTNQRDSLIEDVRVVDKLDRHLGLQLDSIDTDKQSVRFSRNEETGLISFAIPGVAAGENVRMTYWAKVDDQLGSSLGHIGTRAYLTGEHLSTHFSDDPDTELFGDRTVLLLKNRCTDENYLSRWSRFSERLSDSPPLVSPGFLSPGHKDVVSPERSSQSAEEGAEESEANEADDSESGKSEELTWILFGDRGSVLNYFRDQLTAGVAGEDSRDAELLSSNYPTYAFFGAGEMELGPNTGELYIGYNTNFTSVGGSAELYNESGSIYTQKYSDLPVYFRLSATDLKRFDIDPGGQSSMCRKEYLPYILDLRLFGNLNDLSGNQLDDFISLFKLE